MKKMSMSDASEIIIDVKDVRPAQRHSNCCIYKVPNKLREVKEEAYTPKLISSEEPTLFLIKIFCYYFLIYYGCANKFLQTTFFMISFFFLIKKELKFYYPSTFQPGNQTSWVKIKIFSITHFLITHSLISDQMHP